MPGARDRLAGSRPKPDRGLSALDLAGPAPNLLRVMRMLLRTGECAHAELRRTLEVQPEGERLSSADLDEALKTLLSESWIVRSGEGESAIYRANFARRGGHVLDSESGPARRDTTVTMKGIWSKLDGSEKR